MSLSTCIAAGQRITVVDSCFADVALRSERYISKTTTSLAFEFRLFVAFDFIMQLLLLLYKLTGLLLFTLTSFTLTLYFWDFWDFRQPKT